jgi:hypothetical protein
MPYPDVKGEMKAENPKKPITSYLNFYSEKLPEFKKAHPDISHALVVKEIAKSWNSLSEEAKKGYKALAASDTARYKREVDQLEKQGFFTNSKGEHCKPP